MSVPKSFGMSDDLNHNASSVTRAKLVGGIFLIVGTSIGAGMLALPVTSARAGFVLSSSYLFLSWLFMTISAFFILEVNLWFPKGNNLISMVEATLGKTWRNVAWVIYLFLLYSLLTGYIIGGADLLGSFTHLDEHTLLMPLLFVLLFGGIVSGGIATVDWVNRLFIIMKFGFLFSLLLWLGPQVEPTYLMQMDTSFMPSMWMVFMTSFGFAIVIPSLREYFNDNIRQLRLSILIGSLIPLVTYCLWNAVIMGVLPVDGSLGLEAIAASGKSNSQLPVALYMASHQPIIMRICSYFTSICIITSFLGVAMSLSHCFKDRLLAQMEMGRGVGTKIALLTFLPPMLVAIFFPGGFIAAISVAGVCCILLHAGLPAYMTYQGRYKYRIKGGYRVMGGKTTLRAIMAVSILLILMDAYHLIK